MARPKEKGVEHEVITPSLVAGHVQNASSTSLRWMVHLQIRDRHIVVTGGQNFHSGPG